MACMMFWAITSGLTLLVAAILARALWRGAADATPAAEFDLQVYRDQLAEVERDLARGVVNAEDAERVRTEISRRILAADAARNASNQVQRASTGYAVPALVVAGVLASSAWIYWQLGAPGYGDLALSERIESADAFRRNRPTQAEAEAGLTPADLPQVEPRSEEYLELVDQLREVVANRPTDMEGLRLLAVSERNVGQYTAAHEAFGRYVTLRGASATPGEFSDLADMMILAAGGYISPEAEAALATALQGDPRNGPARYYWGLMLSQTGRPDQAFQIWDRLLREGPPEASWIPPIQAQIDEMAIRAGITYTQPLPGGGRGPSAEDIEAAGELSASERLEMIEGMVAGLSERLATEGGTVQDWAQLITSLGVLGRSNDAFAVYQNALEVFADNPTAIDTINRAGDRAGVAN